MLAILFRHSVNVPWWDQLPFVHLIEKLDRGTLSIGDVWIQHNEHRILVPQVIELGVGKVTGFNFQIPVFMSFVLATTTFGLLISMLKRTFKDMKMVSLLAIPTAWLVFSPIQWINWIWGFQFCFFLGVCLAITTIWLLTGERSLGNRQFYLSILTAALGMYSLGNGMLIWVVGFCLLAANKATRRHFVVWISSALVVAASYFYKFHRSPDSLPLSQVIKEPVAVTKYILGYLGHNLATTPIGARYTGAGLLVALVIASLFVYRRGKLADILSWLGISTFVILTATIAAVSRLNFGINHSLGSSYATISLLFVVSTLVIVVRAGLIWLKDLNQSNAWRYMIAVFLLGVATFPLISSYVSNFYSGEAKIKEIGQHLTNVRHCVYEAKSAEDNCLLLVYPNKQMAWDHILILKRIHWDEF